MKKILKLLSTIFIFFIIFITNVKASTSLTCIYPTSGLEMYDISYVALVQDSYGKMGIFFSKDNYKDYYTVKKFGNNLSTYIENFSKEFDTSGNYPSYSACPSYAYTWEESGEVGLYLFDEATSADCVDCSIKGIISKSDIREESFNDLEFSGELEIFDEDTSKSYFVTGIEKWLESTGRPEEPKPDPVEEPVEDNDYCSNVNITENFCSCERLGVFRTIGWVIFIIKILVPIILIVMGSIDLAKAVVGSKEDEIKKSVQTLVKRLIAGIIIFFIPTLLDFIFNVVDNSDTNVTDLKSTFSDCTHCMFNPTDDSCGNLIQGK